jgi:hypothetical protein
MPSVHVTRLARRRSDGKKAGGRPTVDPVMVGLPLASTVFELLRRG